MILVPAQPRLSIVNYKMALGIELAYYWPTCTTGLHGELELASTKTIADFENVWR